MDAKSVRAALDQLHSRRATVLRWGDNKTASQIFYAVNSARGEGKTSERPLLDSDFDSDHRSIPKDEQKRFLVNGLGFMQPDDFEMQYDKNQNPQNALVQMSMEKIPDFTAGNKMFLNPRIYKLWSLSLPKTENRTQHYYFRHPFIKTDSTFYHLPEGFNIKTLPADRTIQFDYGSFHTTCTSDKMQHTVTITARLILNKSRIPAAKFSETVKFFDQVLEEYNSKIVIERL